MDILEKDEAQSWSEQEFRRSKDWAATKAAYRFFQNDKVTSEKN